MKNWRKSLIFAFLSVSLACTFLSSCSSYHDTFTTSGRTLDSTPRVTGVAQSNVTPIPTLNPCLKTNTTPPSIATTTISVHIDTSCSIGTSQFAPGITFTDTTMDVTSARNSIFAINNVQSLIKNAITYENTQIMGWGAVDPWPDPSSPEPSDWSTLDSRMRQFVAAGTTPVITLADAPWWMKGILKADGTTQVLTASDEWGAKTFGTSRILDNKMGAWLHLVQRIAERYMVAPYNVRYFQVWNELKGYLNPVTNNYDISTSPGNPGQPTATHGYTFMYNQVYARLMQVATALKISTSDVKVGGPYVFMDLWSKPSSNLSSIHEAYGTYDQRNLDAIQYWLQHKLGAGFITIDGSIEARDAQSQLITDPFTSSETFANVVQWIRSLDNSIYPGAATLPVWYAEWFTSPHVDATDTDYDNAVKAYAMIDFIKAGGSTALSWNNVGDGWADKGLWTTTGYGGGKPQPWYNSYKAFHDDFLPGTVLYKTTVSVPDKVETLASASQIMLVNKTASYLNVNVDNASVSLSPYQVSIVKYV